MHRHWLVIFLAFLLACDNYDVAESTELRAAIRLQLPDCGGAGGLFGPCVNNVCNLGALCFTTLSGDVCVPPLVIDKNLQLSEECVAQVGAEDLLCDVTLGFCRAGCSGESGCNPDMTCDPVTGSCVHPW